MDPISKEGEPGGKAAREGKVNKGAEGEMDLAVREPSSQMPGLEAKVEKGGVVEPAARGGQVVMVALEGVALLVAKMAPGEMEEVGVLEAPAESFLSSSDRTEEKPMERQVTREIRALLGEWDLAGWADLVVAVVFNNQGAGLVVVRVLKPTDGI